MHALRFASLLIILARAAAGATSADELTAVALARDAFQLTSTATSVNRQLLVDSTSVLSVILVAPSRTLTVTLVAPNALR